jgi:hypothetical protein
MAPVEFADAIRPKASAGVLMCLLDEIFFAASLIQGTQDKIF